MNTKNILSEKERNVSKLILQIVCTFSKIIINIKKRCQLKINDNKTLKLVNKLSKNLILRLF